MLRAAPLVLAAALAACSPRSDPPATPPTGTPATDSEVAAAVPTSGRSSSGSGLVGQVSPLKSGVSGLNVRVTDMGTIIDLPADALFEFDRADLTPAATEQLDKSAQLIREAPAGPIKIVGHTDSKGDDAYNLKLSQDRARSVADWFGGQVGVRQRHIDVEGRGEADPVEPNQTPDGKDNPAGRARNRRVEVILPNQP